MLGIVRNLRHRTTDGKKYYIISNNDVIGNDSWIPRGEGPGSDDKADDLLTPRGGGLWEALRPTFKNRKKRGRPFKHHSLPRCCRKMLLSHIEICFQGSVRAFPDISSFAAWVNSVEGISKVIGICGVGSQHGHGNPLLNHFVTLDLHLEGPPGRWWRRCIGYL